MRKPKPTSSLFAFTICMSEDEGTFTPVSARLLATAANILGLGWGPNQRRTCFCDKGRTLPWQMPVGQAGAAHISWLASAGRCWSCCVQLKGAKLHVPAAELWKELVLDVDGASHLSLRQTWQDVSVGLVQLCIIVSKIGVTATRLFCALVFPSVGQDLRKTKRKLGIQKDFTERTIRSLCCRELICEVRASRTCPSKPPKTNQGIKF